MKKLPIEVNLYEAWEIRIALYRSYKEVEDILGLTIPKEIEDFFKQKKKTLDKVLDKVDGLFGKF